MRRAIFFLLFSSGLFSTPEMIKLSEALGHVLGKNIEQLDLPLDPKALAKGLQNELDGKVSPMNEEECMREIAALQEKKSLQEAEDFLQDNGKQKDILSLEKGKLQYRVTQKGSGDAVQEYNSPLIRCSMRTLKSASSSYEKLLSLAEAPPGLRLGLTGMKEGEARTLYIHPDLTDGNALLIFDVEILRADAKTASFQEGCHLRDLPEPPMR